jgi:hypothetical protein
MGCGVAVDGTSLEPGWLTAAGLAGFVMFASSLLSPRPALLRLAHILLWAAMMVGVAKVALLNGPRCADAPAYGITRVSCIACAHGGEVLINMTAWLVSCGGRGYIRST